MEKLKDFIHDSGDTFISVLIVIAIVGVVSWKITGTMGTYDFNKKVPLAEKTPPTVEQVIKTVPEVEIVEEAIIELPNEEQTPASTVATDTNDTVSEIISVTDFNVTIKPGSIASTIADTLKEEGVISDTSEFIERLKSLGLEQKLQSGDYTFRSDMTLTEIIKKLAHVKS